MTPCDLVELAAHLAMQSSRKHGSIRISESGLSRFWQLACERRNAWERTLARLVPAACLLEGEPASPAMFITPQQWRETRKVLEEVFVSEILTRVWTALTCDADRSANRERFEPIARNVFQGHLHVRREALAVLTRTAGIPAEEAADLNRLRRRCERWNDMLLGYLGPDSLAEQFAFDRERTREFAAEAATEVRQAGSQVVKSLVLAALRATFGDFQTCSAVEEERHLCFAGAVASCLPGLAEELQELEGVVWLQRMEHSSADALQLVERLLDSDADLTDI